MEGKLPVFKNRNISQPKPKGKTRERPAPLRRLAGDHRPAVLVGMGFSPPQWEASSSASGEDDRFAPPYSIAGTTSQALDRGCVQTVSVTVDKESEEVEEEREEEEKRERRNERRKRRSERRRRRGGGEKRGKKLLWV